MRYRTLKGQRRAIRERAAEIYDLNRQLGRKPYLWNYHVSLSSKANLSTLRNAEVDLHEATERLKCSGLTRKSKPLK